MRASCVNTYRKQPTSKIRGQTGFTTTLLVLTLAFGVVFPLGLLGFEMLRFTVIQQELRNIADAAALAGTAAMASAPSPPLINSDTGASWTPADRQFVAMCVAAQTFGQNSVLQTTFSLAPIAASADGTTGYTPPDTAPTANLFLGGNQLNPTPPTSQKPALHTAILNIILLDQAGKQVATGASASTIEVQAYYSDIPAFLGTVQMLGDPNLGKGTTYTVTATSSGALPSIDLLLCFDTSGSMDDQTMVWFYNRFWYWQANNIWPSGWVQYNRLNAWNTLAASLAPATVGTQVNAYPPQNLSYAGYPPTTDANGNQTGGNKYPFCFSETPASSGINPNAAYLNGLRAAKLANLNKQSQNVPITCAPPPGGNVAAYANPARFNTQGFTFVNYATAAMPEAGLPPGNYNYEDPTHWRYSPATSASVDKYGNKWANGLDPTLGNNWNTTLVNPNPMYTANWLDPTPFNNTFTDMVVAAAWWPLTIYLGNTPYTWTNSNQMIESSRGNCESAGALQQALGGPVWGGAGSYNEFNEWQTQNTFTPKPGYFAAYWLFVLQNSFPISTSLTAANNFFETMQISADTHFGLEAFAGTAATLNGMTNGDDSPISGTGDKEVLGPLPAIDAGYLPKYYMPLNPPTTSSADGTLPLPCIALNNSTSASSTNFSLITGSFLSSINNYPAPTNGSATLTNNMPLVPSTGTDIADALNEAISIVTNSKYSRPTAQKIIILFTDGIPSTPGATASAAYDAAIASARKAGGLTPSIPIYTIGLSQNTDVLPSENNLLGDGQTVAGVTNPKGIAYYSSPGTASYYSIQSATQLEDAFQQIARSLCVIK
jgi:hypothetical protein